MRRNLSRNITAISKSIIAIILVVVIVAGAAVAYFAMTQNSPSSSPSPSPTPTPTNVPITLGTSTPATATPSASATQTAEPTATASSSSLLDVNNASSLKYTVTMTESGSRVFTYTLWGKNAGTSNFMMRIEYLDDDTHEIYIINGVLQKAWSFQNGEWQDDSAIYSTQLYVWNGLYQGYNSRLAAWNGNSDYSYSVGPDTWRIYDIAVNPTLEDSLFEHN